MVDWSDPKSKISKYFTVHEATYLPSWEIYHTPSEAEKREVLILAERLDLIRDDLEKPLHVHCWIRPTAVNCPSSARWNGKNYNSAVGGAPGSAHIEGKACDFNASSWVCDDLREYLIPKLQELNLRMENKPSSSWVHIDTRTPLQRQSRYFRP